MGKKITSDDLPRDPTEGLDPMPALPALKSAAPTLNSQSVSQLVEKMEEVANRLRRYRAIEYMSQFVEHNGRLLDKEDREGWLENRDKIKDLRIACRENMDMTMAPPDEKPPEAAKAGGESGGAKKNARTRRKKHIA